MEFALEGAILLIAFSILKSLVFPVPVLVGAIIAQQHAPSSNTTLMLTGAIIMMIAAIPSAGSVFILQNMQVELYGHIQMVVSAAHSIGSVVFAIGFILYVIAQKQASQQIIETNR